MPSERLYSRKNLEAFRKDQQGQCTWSSAEEDMTNTELREGQIKWGFRGCAQGGLREGPVPPVCLLLFTPYISMLPLLQLMRQH